MNPRVVENLFQFGPDSEYGANDGRITLRGNRLSTVCSFTPMAWIHVKTEWTSEANGTLPGGALSIYIKEAKYESEDEDRKEFRCKQGYETITPGDPYHQYSNAARPPGPEVDIAYQEADKQCLMRFIEAFDLKEWLHPFQWFDRNLSKETDEWPRVVVLRKTTNREVTEETHDDEFPDEERRD